MKKIKIGADWKDFDGFFNQLLEKLPELGLEAYEDPDFIGSDWYGLIIERGKKDNEQN